jgi:hypothetical protein
MIYSFHIDYHLSINFSVEKSNSVHNNVKQNQNKFISYNVKNIPNDWMTDLNVINSINECINNIEYSNGSQCEMNKSYNGFVFDFVSHYYEHYLIFQQKNWFQIPNTILNDPVCVWVKHTRYCTFITYNTCSFYFKIFIMMQIFIWNDTIIYN